MSKNRAFLRTFLRGGTAFTAIALSAGVGLTHAQQASPPAGTQTAQAPAAEEGSGSVVVVTGSRLRTETFDSPNPIAVIGSEEIDGRQAANAIDVLEDVPLIGIGTNNRGTQVQNGDSFAFPDVLDLGTQRTLTLLNGRRVIASNAGSVFVPGNASGSQVDLSVFNPQTIERVEVVAGTGGAIYGADAVGGVVNLITKDDFEGLQVNTQYGATDSWDGEQFRISTTWGSELFDGRGHLMLSADYFNQDIILSDGEDPARYQGSGIANTLEGSVRNPAAFSAASGVTALLGGGALPGAFLPQASDGVRATYFGPLSLANPLASVNGVLVTGQTLSGFTTNSILVPTTPVAAALAGAAADPQGFAFFAPSALPTGVSGLSVINTLAPGTSTAGLSTAQITSLALNLLQRNRPTPYEYFLANPGLNQNLFLGTFGANAGTGGAGAPNGGFPTIANTDPATRNIFPRIAVPLAFDPTGTLVAYNPGNLVPPEQARLGLTFGGQGYDSFGAGHVQVQAGTERLALASIGRYDFTDTLRWRSQAMFTRAVYDQSGGATSNLSSGSVQAGGISIPVYVDQNPFLNTASRNTINQLAAQGLVVPTIGGQRVLFMGRALNDVLGGKGLPSTLRVENFQITQSLEGEFKLANADFYWDVAGGYGRSDQESRRAELLDTEFALATDVVIGPNGQPVCRQQTLANPEAINVRNPALSGIVQTVGLVPTREQVAACRPLNLFGDGAPSAEAKRYVLGDANAHALNTLMYYSGSIGSDLFELPAGPFQVGINAERREESAEFEPSLVTQQGRGRVAPQGRGAGKLTFDEYGYEVKLPVFGRDFGVFGMRELDFSYAFRTVERNQESQTALFTGTGTSDDTFNYSVRYKPVEDLTFRAAKSRTVRSASLTELVGPFTVAFTGLTAATHPCATANITQGPAPATRRANCIAAVQSLGIASNPTDAATFLSTFISTAGTRPANAGGNPGLSNEEANSYTLGVTYEPFFIPRLVLAADFYSVDLTNEIGLTGPGDFAPGCFDSPNFPNTLFGGARACDTFLLGTPTGPGGSFVIPSTNAITGQPGGGGVLTGSQAFAQAPFEIAFAGFANINLGKREFRGVNVEARYNFGLNEVPLVGGMMDNWGDMNLRATYFHTQRYDIFGDGVNLTDRLAGEHTNPEHEVRLDVNHRVGPFSQTLQSFWTSSTVTNVLTAKGNWPEQSPAFEADAFWFFNYFASFDIMENLTARIAVNNLFDTDEPRDRFGLPNNFDGGVGREIIFGLNAKF